MLNQHARRTVCSVFVILMTVLAGSPVLAGGAKKKGAQIVYRSMAEVPRIATPGKMVDFLDQRWVEDSYSLTRQLNRAEKLPEPVLKHKNINCPLAASGTVLRNDDGTFGLYYQATPRFQPWAGIPKDASESVKKKWRGTLYKYFLHYATSKDGIHWDLPNLGLRNSSQVHKMGEAIYVEG